MQVAKLSNGLTFICYPIEHAQSVEIGLYIKAGSRYESESDNGITHLLEHMHFRQLGYMSQEQIYMDAECMGSTLRGTTYKDMLHFYMKVRPKYLDKAVLFFENVLTTYNWSEIQFESEKKIVLNEIREKEDKLFFQTITDKAIWTKHSLSQQILGNVDNVENISLEKLVEYKEQIFCRDNIALVITGAMEQGKIKAIIKSFEAILLYDRKAKLIDRVVEIQFKRKPNIILGNFSSWSLLDVQLSFDINLEAIKENELLFLNSIIGGGDGSLLQKEIREKLGLVYEIYSEAEIYNGAAVVSIMFSIDKKNLHISLKKIAEVLKNLKTNISQTDVDSNIVFFTDNLWYWTEDSHELNFQLGCDFVKGKKLLTIEERIEENNKLNYSRMREIADFIFRAENMSLIIMGSTYDITKKSLREIFEG